MQTTSDVLVPLIDHGNLDGVPAKHLKPRFSQITTGENRGFLWWNGRGVTILGGFLPEPSLN